MGEKELGLKKRYENSLYTILENLLILKAYPFFSSLVELFLKETLETSKFDALNLMFLCEVYDVGAIENYFQKKEAEVLQGTYSIISLKRDLNIIKRGKLDDKRIEYLKYRWSGFCSLVNQSKLNGNEIFEYLLYAKNIVDFALIYSGCTDHALREMIGIYLHDKYDVKELKQYKVFRGLDIVKGKTVKVELIKDVGRELLQGEQAEDVESLEDEIQNLIEKDTNKVTPLEKYEISSEEMRILDSIRKHEDLLILNIDMVVSFISFQFYTAAEEILDQLEEDPNYYYLKAELKYRSSEFCEALYFANQALVDFELSNLDKAPFEYLKGLSYEQLGEFEEAIICFDRAVLLDATFKSAKDKIT